MKITDTMTLAELQQYIENVCTQRGFNDDNVAQKLVLLTEEVGELAKAVRKTVGLKSDSSTSTKDVEEEIADVLIVLLDFANKLGVDVVTAIEQKENKNRARSWSQ